MADRGKAREPIWTSAAALALLGPVRLLNSAGDDHTPKTRKSRALLAVVALASAPVPRARLCDLLWGDRGEEQAKASLRQALYELGLLTESGALSADRQFVSLATAKLPTDIAEIERRIAKRDFDGVAAALEQVQLPLLSGLDDLTPELDEWLRDERSRLTGLIGQGGAKAAEAALSSGQAAAARRIADCLARVDPLDERAAQAGVRSDIALGDRAAAHRRIARLERRLRDELGLEPSSATRALLSQPSNPKLAAEPGSRSVAPQSPTARSKWRWALLALPALLLIAVAVYLLKPGAAPANPNVAILPFKELGQTTPGYFASGVSDEILNLLSHERQIRVLGRVSAEEIADRPNSLEIARNLGITHLLDGSVRTADDRVLVIVTLTRVADGAQMWSERYERRLGDIFAVQGDIAQTVAVRLSRSFGKPASQATRPEVYDRYLAARQLLRDRREVTLKEADRLLREAIRLDPNYAPLYAELAQVLILRSDQPTSYGALPYRQARAEAEPLARKAIQLDPNLGDAYAALGFLYLYDQKATPYYQKAVALSPQRSEYHRWLAQSLWIDDRYDEALEEYRRAIEIDPLWVISYEHLTGQLHFMGRDAEAAQIARRFLTLNSDERSRLQLLRSFANDQNRVADNLRYARALYERFPDERIMKFWYASPLSSLGEHRQAARLMESEPATMAIFSSDWDRLAAISARMGRDFWDRAHLWGSARLLLASGRSDVLVRLYDQAQPLIRAGELDVGLVAIPETVLAMRRAGRRAEADRLLGIFGRRSEKLPAAGLGQLQRQYDLAVIASLDGRTDEALTRLDQLSRRQPLALPTIPAVSLVHNPFFSYARNDARLRASDERVRFAVNSERGKAGLPPINRAAWISDPKTLLTKN